MAVWGCRDGFGTGCRVIRAVEEVKEGIFRGMCLIVLWYDKASVNDLVFPISNFSFMVMCSEVLEVL